MLLGMNIGIWVDNNISKGVNTYVALSNRGCINGDSDGYIILILYTTAYE